MVRACCGRGGNLPFNYERWDKTSRVGPVPIAARPSMRIGALACLLVFFDHSALKLQADKIVFFVTTAFICSLF